MTASRMAVPACSHRHTYKYFLEGDAVEAAWATLAARYGEIVKHPTLGTMEIRSQRLLFRSVVGGNPITVIRRSRCSQADVAEFHQLIGFADDSH